eukprot:CAMPEP_0197862320 /NCGR_PEP_ID=MMETSP1438-20131217/38995_1 /TAXON_ID=1461541 /ORGANISM="Pterosperma sp., Strain CCMP1384" /LENGTH=287 /DNA_ID=CAMNT_0043479847 /DNA_START=83 /DNA_END=946 /DNA_ORIENTATION=+
MSQGPIRLPTHIRAALAELVATALFVWIGTGTAVSILSQDKNSFVLPIASAFGFGIVTLVSATSHLSGGHINPAVTFSFVLLGQLPLVHGILYLAAQLVGAVLGSALVYGCVGGVYQTIDVANTKLGANMVATDLIDPSNACLLEIMGTFLLIFTVLNTALDKHSAVNSLEATTAPLAIGLAVFMSHLVLIPFTGCGINPARTFGPAIVNSFRGVDTWTDGWWVYYIGPFFGSFLATLVYAFIFASPSEEPELEEDMTNLAAPSLQTPAPPESAQRMEMVTNPHMKI